MKSPYQLLAGAILDLESHPEVKAIMSFAKDVVDRFYGDLRIAAATDKTHPVPFLLMSFDKVSFGDPADIYELHLDATKTGKVGEFLCFENEATAKDALEVFTWEESEVRTFMTMILVSLRQVEVEGPSPMATAFVQSSHEQLKGVLARALFTRKAA
ncbi:hypothetical protein GB928_027665 [Shinella curvata]|uniref:SCP2 domain-containing protein n=1 Tax=Shinella curvata TaxID=1817964 RepID=A0ABT8XMJ4_9HYPH|nr:hypothetical protein [Shinella curvata]MCJ8057187.1 hypothetical protein [Shinella curvata]MDO6124966.1 hypothetical protein [Shinella curvata]